MVISSIYHKIYLTRIIFFLKNLQIYSLIVSIYIFGHLLDLFIIIAFYDIDRISKIYNSSNYPDLGTYMFLGLMAYLVVWAFSKMYICLIDNEHIVIKLYNKKVEEIFSGKKNTEQNEIKIKNNTVEDIYGEKYKNLIKKIKIKTIVFFIIECLLMIFMFYYITTFCSVYTGTVKVVFKTYGIGLIEVIIIKVIYGTVLAILKKMSLIMEVKILYNVVRFMDLYIS